MKLNHPNIVPLVAYCFESKIIYVEQEGKYFWAEKPERLLCLEYMPEGSLRGYLSDESCGLDWDRRYKIIEGICFGLHYLHEEWNPKTPIIHMDLKPANILLDVNMVPKIADFGLSRLFGEEQTRTCTTNRFGTW
ncbi:putative receptor-like protein kinase [Panicum miliaceum]|uniref:non-specific serine/threonine protein kinase n=1 Tax=Panicum miliaceum TaxID=4540 RepID=A0A3L6PBC9_PANMI|nr:putative receptor-like protein kinase [Panicum miliaceum]